MRTIQEIRDSIAADFMANTTIADAYGFTAGSNFSDVFSKVSLEGTLFYIFACAAWVVESLFESHSKDVETALENRLTHKARWYRNMMLGFMAGKALVEDTDTYDTTGMTDDEIAAAKVVKYAAATENSDSSLLTIKVAGENAGARCKLSDETETALLAYIAEIKDAGVRVDLVNSDADTFSCSADIYYDPMVGRDTVKEACEAAVKDYIENLPFNGEYTNMALVGALQSVEGVKVVELHSAETYSQQEEIIRTIEGRYTPTAGYFSVAELNLNMIAYE